MSRTTLVVVIIIVLAALLLLVAFAGGWRDARDYRPPLMGTSSTMGTGQPVPVNPYAPTPTSTPTPPPSGAGDSGKVIYGMSQDDASVNAARADCSRRGGTFDACGTSCGPDELCPAVCMLTCEY